MTEKEIHIHHYHYYPARQQQPSPWFGVTPNPWFSIMPPPVYNADWYYQPTHTTTQIRSTQRYDSI